MTCAIESTSRRASAPSGSRLGLNSVTTSPANLGVETNTAQGVDRFVVSEPVLVQDVCRGEFSGVDHIDVEMNQYWLCLLSKPFESLQGGFFGFAFDYRSRAARDRAAIQTFYLSIVDPACLRVVPE